MIHGFLFLFKVKQAKAHWVFCAHREENQIAKCRTSLKVILQCYYLHANLFSQPPHFSTDKSHSPSQDWSQNCPNQMDKGAELFPAKIQIFTESAVFTMATHPRSTLLGTWTTEVMRIYFSLSNSPLSFRVRRIIPLNRYLDIFLVLIQLMLH